MSQITASLNQAFLRAVDGAVHWHSDERRKPLCVDLYPPNPQKLRIYMYSLVGGVGTVRPNEYKVVLRVPGQPVGEYASFEVADHRIPFLIGYCSDLDVFALWDPALHHRFKNGTNVQVRDRTVHAAAAVGRAEQLRAVAAGVDEVVIACQSGRLLRALSERLSTIAGVERSEWARSRI